MKTRNLFYLLIATGMVSGCVFPEHYGQPSSSSIQHDTPYQHQSTSSLPYGLQKKLKKGKPLPPGWQKKLRVGGVLDPWIYNHGDIVIPLDSYGLVTIRVEGKLIRLYQATLEIAEILN
jgi:hypothetical protein